MKRTVTAVRRARKADARSALACVLAVYVSACGGSSVGPSSTALRVTNVTPSAVTTRGGTLLTISGVGFSAGAMVLIGGAAATQLTVVNSTTMTAIAPAHDAGSAAVVVAVNGQSASLAGAVR